MPAGAPLPARQTQTLLELQAILENATVGILFSRNRLLVQANPRCAQMFGYAPGELVGRSTALLHPSDDAFERFTADAFPVIERGGTYEAEVPHLRRDGTPIVCHVSGRAIDPADLPQGLIWIVQDVTADLDTIADGVDFVCCALDMDKEEIRRVEDAYAQRETPFMR